jgi:CIC family chloride channel protein
MSDHESAATEHRGWKPTAAIVVAASVIGIVTGIVALGLEHLVDDVVKELFEGPVWLPAAAVVVGALVTAVIVRFAAGGSTASTEVYVDEFHEESPTVEPKYAPGRLLAAFTTLASGAPLGMEGPAVYTGTVVATGLRRRWPMLGGASHNPLLVAGAAAGVAAVFKAPVAGAIFALEVPFRGRLAGERVLPAVFGSATGFLTMASLDGVEPELQIAALELTYAKCFGALALGLVIGIAAHGVIAGVQLSERLAERVSPWVRALLAGGVLAGMYAIGRAITDEPIALASGNNVIEWALEPDHAVGLLIAVFVLRALGPSVAIAGGGVGGLFIPLMAAGAVVGRLFADAAPGDEAVALYVIVGAASMLGAGYGVPLTAVVFVAEYTGQAAAIVPGLLAMAVVRLVVGSRSVSGGQVP